MPNAKDYVTALNYAVDNFDSTDPKAQEKSAVVAKKMEFSLPELKQLRWADTNKDIPENADRAIQIKRTAFDRIANKLPAINETGVLPIERFNIKNFIDEDLPLQKSYLERKGYQVREVGDQLEVKKPDDLVYRPIDPKGLDPMDVLDVTWDVVQGALEGAGTAAKVAGIVAAPETGGLSIPAGFAAGAGAAVTGELLRNEIGRAMGLREPDLGKTAKNVALAGAIGGTTGSILPWAAKGLLSSAANSKLGVAAKQGYRRGAEKLESGLKTIGGKITEGMKYADESVRELEDAIVRSATNWFPMTREIKGQYRKNAEAMKNTFLELLSAASENNFKVPYQRVESAVAEIASKADEKAKSVLDMITGGKRVPAGVLEPTVGAEIRAELGKKLGDKLGKATSLYNQVEETLIPKSLIPYKQSIYDKIEQLRPKEIAGKELNVWLDNAKSELDRIKTFEGMQEFGRSLLDTMEQGTKSQRVAAKQIRTKVIESKSETFMKKIEDELAKLKTGRDPTNKLWVDQLEKTRNDLLEADKLYREINQDITAIVKRPNVESSRSYTAAEKLKSLMDTKPEEIFSKVASSNDVEKSRWLMQKYPDQYKKMVNQKISNIWFEVVKDQASKNPSTRQVVYNELNKLTDSEKSAIFGEGANKLYSDLNKLVLDTANSEKTAKFIRDISNKLTIDDEFQKTAINRLMALPESEKLAIFGRDAQDKLNALIDVGNVRQILVNPSKTALNWEILNPKAWWSDIKQVGAEYQRLRQYKKDVLQPANVGKTRQDIAGKLLKPSTFGKIEATRGILNVRDKNNLNEQ